MDEIFFDSEEFKNSDMYDDFMKNHPKTGSLKIQAYTANQAYPLGGVDVEVYKILNGQKVIFFEGTTNSSGIIDDIILPTVKAFEEVNSPSEIVFTTYQIHATYPKNNIEREYELGIFDDIKVIQPIRIPITTILEGDNYSN